MTVWIYLIGIVLLAIASFEFYRFRRDILLTYKRLNQYDVRTLQTHFGKMNYLDEGTGEPILIAHGIFGGYDQGMTSLTQVAGEERRKIAPSRFGYLGSTLPKKPTPKNQAKAFVELLDHLAIPKCYIIATSAGGAAGLRMALDYPNRVKGLILLSSGAPDRPRTPDEIKEMGMQGPPAVIVNDFIMWFALKHFGSIFSKMMGVSVSGNQLFETMLPASPRRKGVKADAEITNIDMTINYTEYAVEELQVPLLVCHAKDDPMASFENIAKLLERVDAETAICETGGHTIEGNGDFVADAIRSFIDKTE